VASTVTVNATGVTPDEAPDTENQSPVALYRKYWYGLPSGELVTLMVCAAGGVPAETL
jgi:hypothetical protein